ncbi:MAG: hypothetical protein HY744_24805 [Deltaproteobacteria bacterium]|nr:hypothetical protein [Deltaproteobacteria bacterium]
MRVSRTAPATALRAPAAALAVGVALGLCAGPAVAQPKGQPLAARWAPQDVRVDGVLKEWPEGWSFLDIAERGSPDRQDLFAKARVAYDEERLYVAAQVTDDKLVGGADRVELFLGFPGGQLYSVSLYPGAPGRRAQATLAGAPVRGAEVVEGPLENGWVLEAALPWSAFSRARSVRVGLRGALFVHDADRGGQVEAVVGTSPSRAYADLPPFSTEPELGLGHGLLREKRLVRLPDYNLVGNVAGDGFEERVLVYDQFLVVLGSHYRQGEQYFFRDLGVDAGRGMLPSLELLDLTGDGRKELVLRKRLGSSGHYVEVLEVLNFVGAEETPSSIFAHEVALKTPYGVAQSEVRVAPAGLRSRIVIAAGRNDSVAEKDRTRLAPPRSGADPLLLPWGPIASRSYALSGGSFRLVEEKPREPERATPAGPGGPGGSGPAGKKAPATPPQLVAETYEAFKRDRGVSGAPRFDLRANVFGDRRSERLVVHGIDLAVFGEGFREGSGYAVLRLSAFAQPEDLASVGVRDLTGDGVQEIIVTGVARPSPGSGGAGGEIESKLLFVYQLGESGIRRIFAAEIERRVGAGRIVGSLRYVPAGGSVEIELGPGKAVGLDEQSYPFGQEEPREGGVQPLILPWSGIGAVRYRYDGQQYVR